MFSWTTIAQLGGSGGPRFESPFKFESFFWNLKMVRKGSAGDFINKLYVWRVTASYYIFAQTLMYSLALSIFIFKTLLSCLIKNSIKSVISYNSVL